jgi:hypothetical protein
MSMIFSVCPREGILDPKKGSTQAQLKQLLLQSSPFGISTEEVEADATSTIPLGGMQFKENKN